MKIMMMAAALASWLAGPFACAGDFSGAYVGGDFGLNRSSSSGMTTSSPATAPAYGLEGGYGWNVGSTLLGVDGFVDANQQAAHSPFGQYGSNAYGLGLKVGVPIDSLMPYARLGYDRTRGSGSLSGFDAGGATGGVGLAYKLAPSWSVEGEWSTTALKNNGTGLRKENFSLGLNYHFDTPASVSRDKAP